MDQPGSVFKKELVNQYLNQAPLMFQVSKPPKVIDITQDHKKEKDLHNTRRSSRAGSKNVLCNEPKVNQFMVERGKTKIMELYNENDRATQIILQRYRDIENGEDPDDRHIKHVEQLGNIKPEVMAKLHDIMRPIDERNEFKKYWDKRKITDLYVPEKELKDPQ